MTCRTCGARIRYLARRQARANRAYCSWACRCARPLKLPPTGEPREVVAAWLWGAPSVTAAAELHGVTPQTLHAWCRRYGVCPTGLLVRADRRQRPQLAWWA